MVSNVKELIKNDNAAAMKAWLGLELMFLNNLLR
jgi:hypothetical protein